jgi:isocitrate/isopropylmalate dehydrogenase
MPTKTPITVAHGDGIGAEIMDVSLSVTITWQTPPADGKAGYTLAQGQ